MALLDKLDSVELRERYAAAAVENGWSRDMLALQIDTRLHERSGKAISNGATILPPAESDLAQQATEDPYLFDFLSQTDTVNERALERGLVEHAQQFLLELGQGFAFVGRQVKLVIDGQEFFCDLLFHHYRLRRFVVIVLKAVAFEPGHVGQLGMYLAAVDDLMAQPDDGPTIGLLPCRTKDDVVAEYALRGSIRAIGVAEWATRLTRSLPTELAGQLLSIDELESELRDTVPADPGHAP